MPSYGPISRRDLIAALRRLGWSGPFSGSTHDYMSKDHQKIQIPNPHEGNISVGLLARILKRAGISRTQWEQA